VRNSPLSRRCDDLMEKDEETRSGRDMTEACYVAHCPIHDWEGQRRDTASEATADLAGHRGWFPDESHAGSGVRRC
jgi:hypothetical protein